MAGNTQPGVLSWLHIGDLHMTEAGLENHRDLGRIVALANALPPGSLDFTLLPGDNADDGTPEQFALVRNAVAPLRLPLHIMPGDHDFKPRSLDAYHQVLGAEPLPASHVIGGHRCLFLDVVSAGTGGPDFRLGEDQVTWLDQELEATKAAGQGAALFMHTYPADLREGVERLGTLLARPEILCVDMGHTHYNELANDGSTVFMATRSTGQVEEGPPGFSVAALDGRAVSWRFKALDRAWPFVLITRPADRRLATGAADAEVQGGPGLVRTKVLADAPVRHVEVQADNGAWQPMAAVPGAAALWTAQLERPADKVRVRAVDADGRTDEDAVEPLRPGWEPPARKADGSDADSIGAWPERGLLGTQLGPNRKGKKW